MKCKGKCIPQTFFLSLAGGQVIHWGSEGGESCVLENRSRIPWAWGEEVGGWAERLRQNCHWNLLVGDERL